MTSVMQIKLDVTHVFKYIQLLNDRNFKELCNLGCYQTCF